MLSFVWTYLLPSTGLALLAALLWSKRRERRLAVELALLKAHFDETGYRLSVTLSQLDHVNQQVATWKAAGEAAAKKLREAQAEVDASRARFNTLRAKIEDAPVTDDAEGALAWMASVAKELTKEVRG